MRRVLWVVGIAVLLITAGLGASELNRSSTDSSSDRNATVLAEPHAGDEIQYDVIREGFEDQEGPSTITKQWTHADMRLPGGQTPTTAALVTDVPANTGEQADDASGASDLPLPSAIPERPIVPAIDRARASSGSSSVTSQGFSYAQHYESDAGEPVAVSYAGTWLTETVDQSREVRIDATQLLERACTGSVSGQLVTATADEARRSIQHCLDRAERLVEAFGGSLDAQLETRWDEDPEHDEVWIAQIDTTYTRDGQTSEATREIVADPDHSIIVSDVTERTTTFRGETQTRTQGIEANAIDTTGEDPLFPAESVDVETPSVSVVDWTLEGPTEGDLGAFPLADAYASAETTSEGASFFAEAEDPRITFAQFADRDRHLDPSLGSHSANGVECEDQDAPEAPGEAGERSWFTYWTSEESGGLLAVVDEPRVARDNPVQDVPARQARTSHYEDDDAWPPFGITPALHGPALDELWDHRGLAENFQDKGTPTLSVHTDYGLADPTEGPSLNGQVGLGWCDTENRSDIDFQKTTIGFDDGQADRVQTLWITQG